MRKLIYLLLTLLVLTACTDRWEYALMRHGLDSLNERNRNDKPFTAADVQPYIDYFDRHGEPNDRLLAYYLLGRAYHEQGEAPMTLEQYLGSGGQSSKMHRHIHAHLKRIGTLGKVMLTPCG